MESPIDMILEAGLDCLKMLPFLLAAFLLIEFLEHHSSEWSVKRLAAVGKAGPFVGAALGLIPQCGFSVMAANLYAGGVITLGTLLAVFLSTSDEALLLLLANPAVYAALPRLILAKFVIGAAAGVLADRFLAARIATPKEQGNLCTDCGCHDHGHGEHESHILLPALRHTGKMFAYLLIFSIVLEFLMDSIGSERLSALMLSQSPLQPFLAALVGLVPNCAASVLLTELYLAGTLSFPSVVAGLCSGGGIGLLVLFRVDRDRREVLRIVGVQYLISVFAGLVLMLIS